MRGDYESKVKLAKKVFTRLLRDVKLDPQVVPQLVQVAMDTDHNGDGRSILVIHKQKEHRTEVYIDGKTTS